MTDAGIYRSRAEALEAEVERLRAEVERERRMGREAFTNYREDIDRAVAEERERCALIAERCDDGGEGWAGEVEREMQHAIRESIAAALRESEAG